jgi:Spy/CpxP family protein refolding chaperone
MRATRPLIVTLAILLLSAISLTAQVFIQMKPDGMQQAAPASTDQDDEELIRSVFDPITADLKLTSTQKSRIIAIATETMTEADPLFTQLDELDGQLSRAAFTGQLDELKIKEVSAKQGALLSEILAMKARAKTNFYRILTDEQRAIVLEQFRLQSAQNLGAISN